MQALRTSPIWTHVIRPSRKAATATSLAAFSHAGAVPATPAGVESQAEAGEGLDIGRLEFEHPQPRPVDPPEGCLDPVRIRERVADGAGACRAG